MAEETTSVSPAKPDYVLPISGELIPLGPEGNGSASQPRFGESGRMPDPENFLGFKIYEAAPTHDDLEGRFAMMNDDSTIQRIYAFLKGAWRAFAPYLGAYGEIYGDAAKTLTLTNANQQYLIGDGSGVGTNGLSAGGVVNDQSNWRVTPVAGNYRVTLTISVSVDRTCKIEFAAANGGVMLANVYGEIDIVTAAKLHVVSVSGLVTLTTAAITPVIKTDTAGAVCTFERINLHIASV